MAQLLDLMKHKSKIENKMKTLKFITIGIMMFFASTSMNGQVSVNINIGTQPSWGPVGYSSVDYYYLPDIECYYDVRATQFIYFNAGVWVRSGYLPREYRGYDLNRGYKVVLTDYHGSRPYVDYSYHKVKYYRGYRGTPQQCIGYAYHDNDRRGSRYNDDYYHGKFDKHGHKHGKGHRHDD